MTDRQAIYRAIDAERARQAAKWNREHEWGFGDCSSDDVHNMAKVAVLSEECGEVARAVLDCEYQQMQRELVQVAAVAVAWLECVGVTEPAMVCPSAESCKRNDDGIGDHCGKHQATEACAFGAEGCPACVES